jgi:hypothetical protein
MGWDGIFLFIGRVWKFQTVSGELCWIHERIEPLYSFESFDLSRDVPF